MSGDFTKMVNESLADDRFPKRVTRGLIALFSKKGYVRD